MVKFYGINDLAVGDGLKKAVEYINKYSVSRDYDVTGILCLENCLKYINSGLRLRELSDEEWVVALGKVEDIRETIGRFWGGVTEGHVDGLIGIDREHHDDFLDSMVRYGVIDRITKDELWKTFEANRVELCEILRHEKIVKWLDDGIRKKTLE